MTRWTRFSLFLIGGLLAVPSTSSAQDEPRPMYELPTITVSVLSEADPLYETASALYQAGEWKQAAELFRGAAEGMPENDANSYVPFDVAARLYFYAGEYTESREMMEHAAKVAEATGDMVAAAYRHVDAAFISVWEGYPAMRRQHVEMAEAYAASGDLGVHDASRVMALTRGVGALPVSEGM